MLASPGAPSSALSKHPRPQPRSADPVKEPRPNRDERYGRGTQKEVNHAPIRRTAADTVFISSKQAIEAAMRGRKRRLHQLYVDSQFENAEQLLDLARMAGVAITWTKRQVIQDRLDKEYDTSDSNERPTFEKLLLECTPLPVPPIRGLQAVQPHDGFLSAELHRKSSPGSMSKIPLRCQDRRPPVVLWLHGVVDSGNIGALCRSALFFGVDAVILSTRGTGSITDHAVKASTGATEHIPIFSIFSPLAFMKQSQANGWQFCAATVPSRGQSVTPLDRFSPADAAHKPTVLVLGNEKSGLEWAITDGADHRLSIAGSAAAGEALVDSLNVGVAGALLMQQMVAKSASASDDCRRGAPERPSRSLGPMYDLSTKTWKELDSSARTGKRGASPSRRPSAPHERGDPSDRRSLSRARLGRSSLTSTRSSRSTGRAGAGSQRHPSGFPIIPKTSSVSQERECIAW